MARKKPLPEGMRYKEDRGCIEYRFRVNGKRYSDERKLAPCRR